MSGQIFLREKWIECGKRDRFYGTQVIHLHVLLKMMKNEAFMIIADPYVQARADNIRWDTFNMNRMFQREMITLKTFEWIAKIYDIQYSKIALYMKFIFNYIKNNIILCIKTFILKNPKHIYFIKKQLYHLTQ